MDPEEFLAGHNIDSMKTMQFMSMAPEQQQAVMAKGSLSSARDPNAVLATRMKQVAAAEKGSFGPAQGCGSAMKGSMGNGPYGGGMSQGGTGKGGKMAMMMQMMEMLASGKW